MARRLPTQIPLIFMNKERSKEDVSVSCYLLPPLFPTPPDLKKSSKGQTSHMNLEILDHLETFGGNFPQLLHRVC